MFRNKIIAVVSGGMDSGVLLHDLIDVDRHNADVDCISFDYGQRHRKELDFAAAMADDLDLRHDIIDLSSLTGLLGESGSSLISDEAVPEGHYAEDNMKSTVVPNRNMIMLAIAGGIAVARGAVAVATGVHAGDHFVYPDCRTGFVGAAALALYLGNEGFGNLWRAPILAPYIHKSKTDIAYRGIELGVDFSKTWSCYRGGEIHCGKCGTCVERQEAINEATIEYSHNYPTVEVPSIMDTTKYVDTKFWREAVANA